MNNQSLVKINLEFAIIVSITLLVLGMNFYNKYGKDITFVFDQISFWSVVVFAVSVLVLAVIYNVKIYWNICIIIFINLKKYILSCQKVINHQKINILPKAVLD